MPFVYHSEHEYAQLQPVEENRFWIDVVDSPAPGEPRLRKTFGKKTSSMNLPKPTPGYFRVPETMH